MFDEIAKLVSALQLAKAKFGFLFLFLCLASSVTVFAANSDKSPANKTTHKSGTMNGIYNPTLLDVYDEADLPDADALGESSISQEAAMTHDEIYGQANQVHQANQTNQTNQPSKRSGTVVQRKS